VGDIEVQAGAGTAFWHTDGSCVARLTYALRNVGGAPLELRRRSFAARAGIVREDLSSLPAALTLAPGESARGDVAWGCDGATLPERITVVFSPPGSALPQVSTHPLTPAPVEPAAGSAPTRAVTSLGLRAIGDVVSEVHNGARVLRVTLEVANPGDAPLRVGRGHFALRLGPAATVLDAARTTWADPQVVPGGGRAQGTLGFVVNGDPGPTVREATVTLAAGDHVAATCAVRLAEAP
jgi:hypothetical protein